ncbi:endoribonuclease L-PSP [Hydrogenispora ethanolica]|uniref:Endoribonuclease L-PSP n=1 Tax=Hydrogenispora ethanolica TaxID=1082276 RepID=A0A4R1S7D8_HYDET|nr:RidA family protein [Hydrogenispora ethanolica]TCL75241.1 endoribonuclease L-PSP [Hydrogenispora ethanolica]
MTEMISTANAPQAIGPYSQAIKVGNLLFVSGQLPADPATGNIVGEDITVQTGQALSNLRTILATADMSLANVVKVSVFLADLNDFTAMNQVYATFFSAPYPARVAVQVARLPKDARVEIEAIACKETAAS